MNDEKLAKAAVKGDDEAFYQIIYNNKDKLYRIAYSYLRNEHDALEAVQETTYRSYINIHKLKQPQYISTWLVRILINYCNDEKRKKERITTLHDNVTDTTEEFNLNKMDIEKAMSKLKPKYRDVIMLKYFEELTITEISQVLDCPEGTIKSRLYRGLECIKNYLNKGGVYSV